MEDKLERIITEIAEIRRETAEIRHEHAETRRENAEAHVETRQYVDRSLTEMRRENAEAHTETRRHFGVIAESLEDKIAAVVEGLAANSERLDRLDVKFDRIAIDHDKRITRLEAASFRSGR